MSKKKVLMVHNFYQIGGGEHTVYKNEVNMLRENGHEVVEYTRSNDELKQSKLKLLLLPFTTIWSIKTYREVKKIIKEQNIEIVHCHNTFPLISPSVYYAARKKKVPVVQTIHNFRFLCPGAIFYRDGRICEECREKQNFKSALKHKCYRNSKIQTLVVTLMLKIHRRLGTYSKINYIFLTDFNRQKFDKLIDINGRNVFVKPNFVKKIRKNEEKKEKKKTENNKVFVYSGRLEDNKGIQSLLKMWGKLPQDFELHIYGTGVYKEKVEKMAQKKSNIIYYGFQPQSTIFKDIENCAAVLITSEWYETFGMSIPESFSLATPVICTDLGNPKAMIEESKGGEVYKIDDVDSFYTALKRIVAKRESYSQNALLYYEEKLSDEVNYEKLREIYDKARVI